MMMIAVNNGSTRLFDEGKTKQQNKNAYIYRSLLYRMLKEFRRMKSQRMSGVKKKERTKYKRQAKQWQYNMQ